MSEEEKDMGGLDRIDVDEASGTEAGTTAEAEETTAMPRPEDAAGSDGGNAVEGTAAPATGGGRPKGGRRKAVCAAVAVVLVAGLGIGVALASRVPSQPEAPAATETATTAATTAASDEDAAPTIQLGVTAEGWDAETSSPVIAHVTNDAGTVDFYHAYDANKAEALEVDEAGTYEVSFVSPVNSDGSIYKVGDGAKVEAATPDDATTEAAATEAAAGGVTTATFERVDAKDVTVDDLNKVAEQVAEAVKKGDSTLSGDTGAAVVQKVTDNAKANPNADTAKVEETTAKAQETAKENKSEAKAPSSTGKSNASTTNKSTSTSTKTSGSSSGSSGSSNSNNSGSSSSSGGNSSSSGSSQQASTPQKKWVAEQGHWETTYSQVWVSNMVYTDHPRYYVNHGGTKIGPFDSDDDAYGWIHDDMDNGGIGGSVIDASYTTCEDQGHYETQATGQKWVVDVPGHWE